MHETQTLAQMQPAASERLPSAVQGLLRNQCQTSAVKGQSFLKVRPMPEPESMRSLQECLLQCALWLEEHALCKFACVLELEGTRCQASPYGQFAPEERSCSMAYAWCEDAQMAERWPSHLCGAAPGLLHHWGGGGGGGGRKPDENWHWWYTLLLIVQGRDSL